MSPSMKQHDIDWDPSEDFVESHHRKQVFRRRFCIAVLVLSAVALVLMALFWR